MTKLKSVLDEIQERKIRTGEFKIIPIEETYLIYREIDKSMKEWEKTQNLKGPDYWRIINTLLN